MAAGRQTVAKLKTTLQFLKPFAHNGQLPYRQGKVICSHVFCIQNNKICAVAPLLTWFNLNPSMDK